MGKSTKKPYIFRCCIGQSEMKKWRTLCNRKIRRSISIENEILDGNFYKKINQIRNCPSDGKFLSDRNKDRRK